VYITIKQAMEKYHVCDATIRNWYTSGKVHSERQSTITIYKRKGRMMSRHIKVVTIDEEDIDRVVNKASYPSKQYMLSMFNAGKTQDEVAQVCHISAQTLRKHMDKEGIKPRTRKEASMLRPVHHSTSLHYIHKGETKKITDKRKRAFARAFNWVNSLKEMPTENEIEGYSNLTWKPLDIREMIETRPERELPAL